MTKTPAENDEPIDVIAEEARAAARSFGVVAPDEFAAALIDRILLRLGGLHLYIPRQSTRDRRRMREEIIARFDGANINALAREYALTPRHIRRILRQPARESRIDH